MRVADFKCAECGEVSELFYKQSQFDEKELCCPHCNSSNLVKLIGSPTIVSGTAAGIKKKIPSGFNEVLGAIKKGIPKKNQNETKWGTL